MTTATVCEPTVRHTRHIDPWLLRAANREALRHGGGRV